MSNNKFTHNGEKPKFYSGDGLSLEKGTFFPASTSFVFGSGASKLTFYPDGKAVFTGDADAAAQELFNKLIQIHHDYYNQLRTLNHRLQLRIMDLEDGLGISTLQE